MSLSIVDRLILLYTIIDSIIGLLLWYLLPIML